MRTGKRRAVEAEAIRQRMGALIKSPIVQGTRPGRKKVNVHVSCPRRDEKNVERAPLRESMLRKTWHACV